MLEAMITYSLWALVIGLTFLLYLVIKYVVTDILMFLQRREAYKRSEAKKRHPSNGRKPQNIFDTSYESHAKNLRKEMGQ